MHGKTSGRVYSEQQLPRIRPQLTVALNKHSSIPSTAVHSRDQSSEIPQDDKRHKYKPSLSSLGGAEEYELPEDADLAQWPRYRGNGTRSKYRDGDTIDWWHEDYNERERRKEVRFREGLRGVLGPLVESSKMWLVVVCTGIGVGITGGWLDVLVKW